VGPLIFARAFTLLGRRVQVAVGITVRATTPVEGEVVLEDVPQLRTYRLWHDWQRAVARRREGAQASQELNP
jgi:hypothetical protein